VTPTDDLIELARVLANWVAPASTTEIYLYGSRVRGDHKPTSDVDVVIPIPKVPTPEDMAWHIARNDDYHKSIDALLPGKLEILEYNDPLVHKVLAAPVVHRDRQVICVWMEPKPS